MLLVICVRSLKHFKISFVQVSSGALDMAKLNLASLLKICAKEIDPKDATNQRLVAARQKAFHDVTRELVKEVTSPNQTVREQVGVSCWERTGRSVNCSVIVCGWGREAMAF